MPFIWSYRRDYLHPVMTRQHLWMLVNLEEEWEVKVESKIRFSDDVAALVDAAKMAEEDAEARSRVRLCRYKRELL